MVIDANEKKKQELSKHLNDVYLDMVKIHGRKYTATEFARWAGVGQAIMNRYLNGEVTPEGPNILAMARVMPKVMDIMEYPDDPILRKLLKIYFSLTPDKQQSVLKQLEDIDP